MSLAGRKIAPMKASPGDLPTGDGWAYEIKWDGMRVVAFLDDDGLRLQTTNLLNATASFPELAPLADHLSAYDAVVLDGELVAFDDDGQPSFHRLQSRMHVVDPADAARRAAETPVMFVVFDLLHLNGHDTIDLPYQQRRELLEQLLEPGPRWQLTGVHYDDAASLLEAVRAQGLEGLVAKRLDSVYREGKRPTSWIKIKPRHRQEFVVGGWVSGDGHRTGKIGALVVGYHDDDGVLQYAGRVGSGLREADLAEWASLIAPLARPTPPFAEVPAPPADRKRFWLEPELVIEVAFAHWTADGHFRHPSFLGRRTDKAAADVVRET